MNNKAWTFYAIFGQNQIEYPGRFVVRRSTMFRSLGYPIPDALPTFVGESLDHARQAVPPEHIALSSVPGDDPSLIEWHIPRSIALGELGGYIDFLQRALTSANDTAFQG